MKALILGLLITCWGTFSAPHARAYTPTPEIVDHATFTQLSSEDQRAYIRLIMLAMVDLEEGFRQVQQLPNTPQNKVLKQTTRLRFEQFKHAVDALFNVVGFPSAHARGRRRSAVPADARFCHDFAANSAPAVVSTGKCVIGGWESTYVLPRGRTSGGYCQRPACSMDQSVRTGFVTAQQHCGSPTKMACNPALYGYRTPGQTAQPFCINVDQVDTQNASLACLIEFENPASSVNARLDALVNNLTTASDPNAVNLFNAVAERIFNICACPASASQTLPQELQLNASYVSYMQNHRTCYSLLGMMRWYASRLNNTVAGSCNTPIFRNPNVQQLMTSLNELQSYTRRIGILDSGNAEAPTALTTANYPAILQRYRQRYVVDAGTNLPAGASANRRIVASNDRALDYVSAIDTVLNRDDVKAMCPYRRPTPLPTRDPAQLAECVPQAAITCPCTESEGVTCPSPCVARAAVTCPGTNPESDDEVADEGTEGEPITVVGRRPEPLLITTAEIPIVPVDLTSIEIPQIEVDTPDVTVAPPANASCSITKSITRSSETSTSVSISVTVTTDPADHPFPEGQNITWSLINGTTTTQLPPSRNRTLTHQLDLPVTVAADSLRLEVRVPGCEQQCSEASASDDSEAEETPEPRAAGTCNLTATAGENGKFTLAIEGLEEFTITSIDWSDNVSTTPAAPNERPQTSDRPARNQRRPNAAAEESTAEVATSVELTAQREPTTYEATVTMVRAPNGRPLTQTCSVTYPAERATPMARPLPQQGPTQPMPVMPDFFSIGNQ